MIDRSVTVKLTDEEFRRLKTLSVRSPQGAIPGLIRALIDKAWIVRAKLDARKAGR